jgi:molybdopterin synthase catalytic subunit
VTRLEYQAYSKLALKTMTGIVRGAASSISRSDHHPTTGNEMSVSSLIRCAIHHRLGTVPVGEPSIGAYDT